MGKREAIRSIFENEKWIVEAIKDDYCQRAKNFNCDEDNFMESFLIKGGVPLQGEVTISGSKNAALPIMAATLLTDEPCLIRGVPDLSDTRFMAEILKSLGAEAKFENGTLAIRAKKISGYADYELVRKMRGSICVAGPLLARLRESAHFPARRLRHRRAANQSALEGI